jgi:undecaprenyl-diphosphatase
VTASSCHPGDQIGSRSEDDAVLIDAPMRAFRTASAVGATVRGVGDRSDRRRLASIAVWIGLGALAVYFLLPQVRDLRASLATIAVADPRWVLAAAGLVGLRYAMAAVSLQLSVAGRLPFGPTLLVQVSASFVGRVTPEGVGWLIVTQRYLERSGLTRASSAAAIALKLMVGAIARVAVMVMVAVLVGSTGAVPIELPSLATLATAGVVAVLLVTAIWAAVRRMGKARVAPAVSALRDLRAVLAQPRRAIGLFGSSALLTISYAWALSAAAYAVGVDVSALAVTAVYLGGTAVAAVSPTPGNIGAVEVALVAGLGAIGVPAGSAIATVVVFRLLTFWLPIVPGFIAFRLLQREHRL